MRSLSQVLLIPVSALLFLGCDPGTVASLPNSSSASCAVQPSLTMTNGATQGASVEILDGSAALVASYSIAAGQQKSDTLAAGTYTIVAKGLDNTAILFTGQRTFECNASYEVTWSGSGILVGGGGGPSGGGSFDLMTVYIRNYLHDPVYVLIDGDVVSDGTLIAGGAEIMTQLGPGGHYVRLYDITGTHQFRYIPIGGVSGAYFSYSTGTDDHPLIEVKNKTNLGANAESVKVYVDGALATFAGGQTILKAGAVATFDLSTPGVHDVRVEGVTSGSTLVHLTSSSFAASTTTDVNVGP